MRGYVEQGASAGFGDYERSFVKKQTRRETFLAEMEEVVPFSELIRMIEPFYPVSVSKEEGRRIGWR